MKTLTPKGTVDRLLKTDNGQFKELVKKRSENFEELLLEVSNEKAEF